MLTITNGYWLNLATVNVQLVPDSSTAVQLISLAFQWTTASSSFKRRLLHILTF